MPALSSAVLWSKLKAALPSGSKPLTSPEHLKPLLVRLPSIGIARVYLWTLTQDRSRQGRPPGEFKIQLIVEGQKRGQPASLNLAKHPTFLIGYSADYGVFVGWEARLYTNFSYSSNVQVREDLLLQARDHGWAVASPRQSQGKPEVRVAFAPTHLPLFLKATIDADAAKFSGRRREAYFLSKAPKVNTGAIPTSASDLTSYIARARRKITTTRLSRDPRFSVAIKREFAHACAVCKAQLGIVEAAHIIPVSEPNARDEAWNGIAMCPNHHKLFDARLFVVDPKLIVRIDRQRIKFLRDSGRAAGSNYILAYADRSISRPAFWTKKKTLKRRMQNALASVLEKAGMR
jgi:putative restriction endonuclease